MSTREWGVGYDEGYMKGWNDAMDEKPAHRKPLTDEEIAKEFYKFESAGAWYQFARAIEAAHGIGEKK